MSSSSRVEELKSLGNSYFSDGSFRKSVQAYSQALQEASSNSAQVRAVLYSNRAAALLRLNEQFLAKTLDLEETVEDDMPPTNALLALSDALQCVRLHGQWAKGHFRLASALFALNMLDDAFTAINHASALDSNDTAITSLVREIDKSIRRRDIKRSVAHLRDEIGPLELMDVGDKGQGFVATKPIPSHTLLLSCKAYAFVLEREVAGSLLDYDPIFEDENELEFEFDTHVRLALACLKKSNLSDHLPGAQCTLDHIMALRPSPEEFEHIQASKFKAEADEDEEEDEYDEEVEESEEDGEDDGEDDEEEIPKTPRVRTIKRAIKQPPRLVDTLPRLQEALDRLYNPQRPDIDFDRLVSILQHNSHSIFPSFVATNAAKGIFPTAAFLNHDCSPNAVFTFSSGDVLDVRSIRPIAEGEEVTVSYVDLGSRSERAQQLRREFGFHCACERCNLPAMRHWDRPMESLRCHGADELECPGYLAPSDYDSERLFRCSDCTRTMAAGVIGKEVSCLTRFLDAAGFLRKNGQFAQAALTLDQNLKEVRRALGPRHATLLQFYVGRASIAYCLNSDEDFQKYQKLCIEMAVESYPSHSLYLCNLYSILANNARDLDPEWRRRCFLHIGSINYICYGSPFANLDTAAALLGSD